MVPDFYGTSYFDLVTFYVVVSSAELSLCSGLSFVSYLSARLVYVLLSLFGGSPLGALVANKTGKWGVYGKSFLSLSAVLAGSWCSRPYMWSSKSGVPTTVFLGLVAFLFSLFV